MAKSSRDRVGRKQARAGWEAGHVELRGTKDSLEPGGSKRGGLVVSRHLGVCSKQNNKNWPGEATFTSTWKLRMEKSDEEGSKEQ